MPMYEFRCQECNNLFETICSSTDTSEVSCSKCGSRKIKKTISAASFKISSSGSKIPSGALSGCSTKSGFS